MYNIYACDLHGVGIYLADHTDARCMIGYWHDTVVCLSVCLSARPSVSDEVDCG